MWSKLKNGVEAQWSRYGQAVALADTKRLLSGSRGWEVGWGTSREGLTLRLMGWRNLPPRNPQIEFGWKKMYYLWILFPRALCSFYVESVKFSKYTSKLKCIFIIYKHLMGILKISLIKPFDE
jgi:hypothetical protein